MEFYTELIYRICSFNLAQILHKLGGVARKKSITRKGQDRTTKKSQKRNISHICGKAPRKDIAMKFGTGVDVPEVVTWAEFDL